MNRREFFGASSAGLIAARIGSGFPLPSSPNDTIRIGIVGPGQHLQRMVVAARVDQRWLAGRLEGLPEASEQGLVGG